MNMRGRVPRRVKKQDVPVRKKPPRLATGFHSPGSVLVPADGSVRILEYRFPDDGVVRRVSLQIPDLPSGVTVLCEIWRDSNRISAIPVSSKMTRIEAMQVGADELITARLAQEAAQYPLTLTPNVAFVFQEKDRAKADPNV